jgi:hypothetical protein
LRENSAGFVGREYDGELCWPRDALNVVDEIQLSLEHLLVQKEQRAESLILSGCGNALFDREMGKELCDLFSPISLGWRLR